MPTFVLLSFLNFSLRAEGVAIRALIFFWSCGLLMSGAAEMRRHNSWVRKAVSGGLTPLTVFYTVYYLFHIEKVIWLVSSEPLLAAGIVLAGISPLLSIIGYLHRRINASLLSNLPLREVVETVCERSFIRPLFATTSEVVQDYVDPDDYEYTPLPRSAIFAPTLRSGFIPRYQRVDELARDKAVEVLLTSAALPLGIVPNSIGERREARVVDGGLADNLPWFPLIDNVPCSEIFIILCEPFREAHKVTPDTWRTAERNIRVMSEEHKVPNINAGWRLSPPRRSVRNDPPTVVPFHEPSCWSEAQPITVTFIAPPVSLGGLRSATMNFDKGRSLQNIQLGREAAREAISHYLQARR